ncbi:biotin--[acetyl-CoA-carboxylase] ligase [Enemella sp. A6]|uniref:biotin--[acetyl-CoA-carboxylase] ligase n=1 Tax=Enemella sp. A6 TaxID=3440152 RepID=UPI003EC07E28
MPQRDPIDRAELRRSLSAHGWRAEHIEVVAETGSTNADLIAAARDGAEAWTVLIASHQTAGRGRFRRSWASPAGSSASISVLLRPERSMQNWPWLSLLTGVALAEAFVAVGVDAAVKWPNDVLAPGGKLCGILAERVETPEGPAVVVGFGINLSMTAEELPVPTATSLLLEGVTCDPTELVADVLARWRELALAWAAEDDDALHRRYLAISGTIGRRIRLLLDETGDEVVQGTAVGVDRTGRILVDVAGDVQAYAAGDVVHLR